MQFLSLFSYEKNYDFSVIVSFVHITHLALKSIDDLLIEFFLRVHEGQILRIGGDVTQYDRFLAYIDKIRTP